MGKSILVLCTGNSCRSQITEGYLSKFAPIGTNIYSAGVETHGVNPFAVETMKREGIDISHQTSNNVDEYKDIEFDFIITVCDIAKEKCPYFPSQAVRFHKNFPDPAKIKGNENEVQIAFDEVRDIIKQYCKEFISAYS